MPAIERSAAQAFAGLDVPAWLLTDAHPPRHWRPHLRADLLWVAVDGKTPVGFLAARRDGDRLHIDEVDVDRFRQGQGLGRRLLAVAIDRARGAGFTALSLTTFRLTPWNGPFYASLGFREWEPADAPPAIRRILAREHAIGLRDRCAMRLDL